MPTYTAPVTAALAAVDEDRFVRCADGSLVTQSTAAAAIAEELDRLDVATGMRVLEIGTGSGYSTALLAELVGPPGHVTSVDVVPELVERAAALLPAQGASHTTVLCRDGASGADEHAPFDRIIAWTTATYLPASWVRQARPGAMIVAPVALTTLSKTGAGVRVEIGEDGEPLARALFSARYVEMHDEVLTQWLIPPYGADVLRADQDGPWWLSGEHWRDVAGQRAGGHLLDQLAEHRNQVAGPLRSDERADDFRAWLLATRPAGLCTAALGDPDWRIGIAIPGSAHALKGLTASVSRWHAASCPGLADLTPCLTATADGWNVRAELPERLMQV